MPNILIFRTDRIGDLLVTCPVIIAIKEHFKESNIVLVGSNKNSDYAKNLNIFDEIYQFPKTNFFKKIFLIFKLYRKKFDYIFVFDGKERSILSTMIIKARYKLALSSKIKSLYKISKIKIYEDRLDANLNDIFQKMLISCNISSKINNYIFLKDKKDNFFSELIPISDYLHIHLDEKWFNNLYIKSYNKINPTNEEFKHFLNELLNNNNILITTGLINFDLIDYLASGFLKEKSKKIYYTKKK